MFKSCHAIDNNVYISVVVHVCAVSSHRRIVAR